MTSRIDRLNAAIAAWLELAETEDRAIELGITNGSDSAFRFRANTYRRCAKALEWERDTGEAVCTCCFRPLRQHRSRIIVRPDDD